MCDGRKHVLKEIYRSPDISSPYDVLAVVHWCQDCGGVVVDRVVDGRVQAGAIASMQFPKNNQHQR